MGVAQGLYLECNQLINNNLCRRLRPSLSSLSKGARCGFETLYLFEQKLKKQ